MHSIFLQQDQYKCIYLFKIVYNTSTNYKVKICKILFYLFICLIIYKNIFVLTLKSLNDKFKYVTVLIKGERSGT